MGPIPPPLSPTSSPGSVYRVFQQVEDLKEALEDAQAYATELEMELSKEMNKNNSASWNGRTAKIMLGVVRGGVSCWMPFPGEQLRDVGGVYLQSDQNGNVTITLM